MRGFQLIYVKMQIPYIITEKDHLFTNNRGADLHQGSSVTAIFLVNDMRMHAFKPNSLYFCYKLLYKLFHTLHRLKHWLPFPSLLYPIDPHAASGRAHSKVTNMIIYNFETSHVSMFYMYRDRSRILPKGVVSGGSRVFPKKMLKSSFGAPKGWIKPLSLLFT